MGEGDSYAAHLQSTRRRCRRGWTPKRGGSWVERGWTPLPFQCFAPADSTREISTGRIGRQLATGRRGRDCVCLMHGRADPECKGAGSRAQVGRGMAGWDGLDSAPQNLDLQMPI